MKTVSVSAAVILRDGKVTAEEALEREIREELDTEIAVEAPFARVEYDYPEFHLSMQCFTCRVIRGSLVLKEHEDAAWLDRDRLDDVRWLPADETVISRLRELLPAVNRPAPDAAE